MGAAITRGVVLPALFLLAALASACGREPSRDSAFRTARAGAPSWVLELVDAQAEPADYERIRLELLRSASDRRVFQGLKRLARAQEPGIRAVAAYHLASGYPVAMLVGVDVEPELTALARDRGVVTRRRVLRMVSPYDTAFVRELLLSRIDDSEGDYMTPASPRNQTPGDVARQVMLARGASGAENWVAGASYESRPFPAIDLEVGSRARLSLPGLPPEARVSVRCVRTGQAAATFTEHLTDIVVLDVTLEDERGTELGSAIGSVLPPFGRAALVGGGQLVEIWCRMLPDGSVRCWLKGGPAPGLIGIGVAQSGRVVAHAPGYRRPGDPGHDHHHGDADPAHDHPHPTR